MKTIHYAAALGLLLSAGAASAQQPDRTIDGRLERSDPRGSDFGPFDEHRISLAGGQRVAITVTSDDFDPMVELYRIGQPAEAIGRNDDDGMTLNSRLVVTAPASGDYYVRVLSFGGERLGAYRVGVTPLAPLPAPVSTPTGTEQTSWRVFQGEIADSDPESEGRRFDDYEIRLRQGELAIIRADSTAFDPMITVMTAAERDGPELASDDDSGPGLGSMLGFEAPLDGAYIIRVHTLNPDGRGAYTLRVGG